MTGTLRRFQALGVAEFNGLRRDRMALFFIFVLPVAMVLVFGFAFGGQSARAVRMGVRVEARDTASETLLEAFRRDPNIALTTYDSAADLRDAVLRSKEQIGLVVPSAYARQVREGSDVELTVMAGSGNEGLAQSAIGPVVTRELVVASAVRTVVQATGADPGAAMAAAKQVIAEGDLGRVESRVAGTSITSVSSFDYSAYTMLVLFTMVTAFASAGTIVELRKFGIARRMLVTPARDGELIVGVVGGRFVTLVVAGYFLVFLTKLIFDVRWGDLWAVSLVVLVLCFCMASLMALAGTFFTSEEQAAAVGVPIAIGLGMLSGTMWPLEIVPGFMQVVGHLFPTAWAVDALSKIFAEGAGVVDVLPDVGILLAFTVAIFAAGAMRLRGTFGRSG